MIVARRLALVFSLASLVFSPPARASLTPPEPPSGGEFLCRIGGELVPMPLLTMDVAVTVDGIMATTRLTQRFDNRAQATVEAVYVFPLPERAAVHHMEIRIGDRRVVSQVQEREQAKRTYETARSEGKKTALVEQERPNLFTTSVGNLNPGESVEVILEYVEEVRYEAGTFGIGFPLTFTPRYVPGAQVTRDEASGEPVVTAPGTPDAARVLPPFRHAEDPEAPRATFRAVLRPGFPVTGVRCRTHAVNVAEHDNVWTIVPAADTLLADRDLILEWTPDVAGESRSALLTETGDGDSYGLLLLVPPEQTPGLEGLPTRTLFVIDVSGSMAGPSIVQARRALDAALLRLRVTDEFDILAFNQSQRLYRDGWVPGDPLLVAHARGWAQALEAEGGTEIEGALLRGLELFDDAGFDGVDRIIFLTDGAVGNEDQILREVVERAGNVHIHAVGIGDAPNRYFIRKLAEEGRGLSTFIFDLATLEEATNSFLRRVERPVLSELRLDAPGMVESYPSPLPDLHAGEPVFVSLRWNGAPPASIDLFGRSPYGPYSRRIPSSPAAAGSAGLSTRWARAKVEDLLDGLHEGVNPDSVRRDVVTVGIAHHLVTPYTSLVAVEERVTAEGAAVRAPVANALPQGSELLGSLPSGGTSAPLLRLVAALLAAIGAGTLWAARRERHHAARAA